ncbi:MAG: PIG-L family deacetylase, partial [Candidatus Eremiobacteraeota bacterium]|nr:PIG-L family deacetylase [Candidatus Eremiobacteraeota bacterium]
MTSAHESTKSSSITSPATTPPRRTLFIFAHQDDEYAAAPWILEELSTGASIACVYLTDGGSRTAPEIRDGESLGVLHLLGASDTVIFLNEAGTRIADRALAAKSMHALRMLENWIESSSFRPSRIYAPSYEGGHPDHDAAHLIAAVVACDRGILNEAWHFSLYNAYRCRRPFFATLRQLPSNMPARLATLSPAQRWHTVWLCWRYISQRKTWLGLFPGAFYERIVARRESVVAFDPARLDMP